MENYLTQITYYLLTQSWQIAVLVVVIAAATLLLKNKSAHIRYLLWLIVLAKCLVPPLFTIPLAVLPQERYTEPVPISPAPMPRVAFEAADMDIAKPTLSTSTPVAIPSRPTVTEKLERLTMLQWLALVWIIGAIVFTIAALIKALRTNFWLWQQRKQLPVEIQSGIEDLFYSLDFRTFPKVWLVEGIGQPFVWGLLRGSIYLPADFVKVNSSEHRRSVLGHELSHFLRFDAAVNILQIIAQAVFWFHPFVWWANKKIRAEREKCCDEMAIARLGAKATDYSSAIVNILISEHKSTRPVPSLAVAGPVKNIEERIKTIMKPGKKFYKHPSLIATTAVFTLALLTVPTTLILSAKAQSKAANLSLRQAAATGNIEQVRLLISRGADVNERGVWGNTPLHYASMRGHAEVAELLISRGAYVNAPDGRNAMTPLHCAAASGNKQTVELLLSKGADINTKNRAGRTPLFEAMKSPEAGRKEIVELLVAKGAKVPAMHLAAYMGDIEKVRKCLQDGIDINSQENFCCTALHAATNGGKKNVTEFLIGRGANIDARDTSGMTPLYYAAIHNCEYIVDLLLSKGADVNAKHEYNFVLLNYAIWDGSKDAIKLLISKGANVNVKDDDGFTLLIWAIWWSDKDMVELLISNGADLDTEEDSYGCTALYWAAVQGSKDLVELLIAKGAAPLSAMHSAACAGDLAKVKSLVKEGTDVNTKGKGSGDETPLFAAVFADHNDVAKFLIAKGADVNAKDKSGQTPLHPACEHGKRNMVELLIAEGADVNAKDYGGATPLHRMFYSGRARLDIAELLIAKGANVNARLTSNGSTPLHRAVEIGHTKIVGLLIAKGADINAQKSEGETPLHIACKLGHKDVVELLIAKGANMNVKNNKGQTALSVTKEQGHEEIVELLRKHGAKE